MKKRFICLGVAAAAMLVSSCQAEKLGQGVSGEVDFTISTSIPSGMTTYAGEDGSALSHLGGATNLDKTAYDLRYIMEVYTKDGDFVYRAVKTSDDFGGVSFEARLLAKEYDFVFWADFVVENTDDDYIYNASSLKDIKVIGERHAGKDEADAYYAVKSVDMTASGQNLGQVVLKRPFGKIRMVATDKLSDGAVGEAPTSAEITYGSDFKVPNAFNALEGKASGEMAAGAYSFEVYQEDAVVSGEKKEGAYIIGYDYIFASDANTSYNFDVVISGASGQIGQRSLSSIPVQENKLTTIIGNFYTNETSLAVVVEDAFDGEETVTPGDSKTHEVNPGDDIQEIIDNAEDGDIIVIAPGVFDGTSELKKAAVSEIVLPTDKSLTFKGANAGISGTAERGEETVINVPIVCDKANVTTADFTFDGFTFTGKGQVTIYRNNGGNITFVNNIIEDTDPSIATFFQQTPGYREYYIGDVVVENNVVDLKNSTSEVSCGFTVWSAKSATFRNNDFANFKHAAAQFDMISGDLNFDGNTFENCGNNNFRVQVVNIDGERNYGSNAADVTERGFMKIEKSGACYDTFAEALAEAKPNDVIVLAEAEFALDQNIESATANQKFYLPIEVEGLTIKGKGDRNKTIIYGKEVTPNGAWGTQTTIAVFAENVTLENLTLMPKNETNKLVEIHKNGFKMINCVATANTKVDGADPNDAASIYFAGDITNGLVEGCVINKGNVCFDSIMSGTFTIKNNVFNGHNQWGDTMYPNFTCSYWGTDKDLRKSKMVVEIVDNEFNDVQPLTESFDVPVVRASYGTFNLDGNKFPTDGVYWKSAPGANIPDSFGMIFVNYNSNIIRDWRPDRAEPKNFAISNDVIEFETATTPNASEDSFRAWQGRKATIDMPSARSSWEASSVLTVTGDEKNVRKSIWIEVQNENGEVIDWPITLFEADETGAAEWKYWDSQETKDWKSIDAVIPTEAGQYELKIAFNNGTIIQSINGSVVASYKLDGVTKTRAADFLFKAYSYGEVYKSTWSYPVVR